LVEGETDTMACWQAMPTAVRDKVGVVGLSGTNAWKDEYATGLLANATRVFVVFDRDDPYLNADAANQTEKSWQKVKKALGRKARRVVLPQGINDVAEFFQRYDWAAFQVLLQEAAEPKRHYKRLDLSQAIPQTDWVVEDLAVSAEAWVVAGDGGVGKSMLTMALALAVAGGASTFLGKKILKHGRVLYVDEESSAALAVQRINALSAPEPTPDLRDTPWLRKPSLSPEQVENLEYLWYAGVDLLGEPELLHEEALEIQPVLVIVDSLSRVSIGGDENSNPDMTKLMRKGVIPIARDTGAAVLVLHHTDKEGLGPRGASSIRNTSDQTLSIKETDSGRKRIFASKPRRQTSELGFEIQGDLDGDGWLRIVDPFDNSPM
jgi:RecA-family ATPase